MFQNDLQCVQPAQVLDVDETAVGETLAMMTRTADGLRANNGTQVCGASLALLPSFCKVTLVLLRCLIWTGGQDKQHHTRRQHSFSEA